MNKSHRFVKRRVEATWIAGALGSSLLEVYDSVLANAWRSKTKAEDPYLATCVAQGRLTARVRIGQIADNLGMSSRAIQGYLQALDRLGWIKRITIMGEYGKVLYCELGSLGDGDSLYSDEWLDSVINRMFEVAEKRRYLEACKFAYRAYKRKQSRAMVLSKVDPNTVRDLFRHCINSVLTDITLVRGLPDIDFCASSGAVTGIKHESIPGRRRFRGEDSPTQLVDKICASKIVANLDTWVTQLPTPTEPEVPIPQEPGVPIPTEPTVPIMKERYRRETREVKLRKDLPSEDLRCESQSDLFSGLIFMPNYISKRNGREGSAKATEDAQEAAGSPTREEEDQGVAQVGGKGEKPSWKDSAAFLTKQTTSRTNEKMEAKVTKKKADLDNRLKSSDTVTRAGAFRDVWIKEMLSNFPDIPERWLKAGRKGNKLDNKNTIAFQLAEAYSSDELIGMARYFLRCWDSINRRIMKGTAVNPGLGILHKYHDTIAKEAYLYNRYMELSQTAHVDEDEDDVSTSFAQLAAKPGTELMDIKNKLTALGVKV